MAHIYTHHDAEMSRGALEQIPAGSTVLIEDTTHAQIQNDHTYECVSHYTCSVRPRDSLLYLQALYANTMKRK